MKKSFLVIALLLCLSLAGCSNGAAGTVNVKWDNGVISVNGAEIAVDKYTGQTAEYVIGGTSYNYAYDEADDLSLAIYNSVGVAETDMSTFKKAKYFQQFLGSEVSMYYSVGDNKYYAARVSTSEGMSVEQMCTNAYAVISKADFGTINYVEVNGEIRFTPNGFEVEVRPDAVVIPGYFKITAETKAECTESIVIGKTTLNYYNSGDYCYYQHGDLLIQTVVGVDISEHITFL